MRDARTPRTAGHATASGPHLGQQATVQRPGGNAGSATSGIDVTGPHAMNGSARKIVHVAAMRIIKNSIRRNRDR